MNYVIFDLEFNNMREITKYFKNFFIEYPWATNPLCSNEIIEIGAVKLDKYLKNIDTLKIYIKPQIFPMLNPRITEITGITEIELENGLSFNDSIDRFREFVGDDTVICSWAKDDISELIINANYHSYESFEWLKEYVDIQEYSTKILAEKKSLSLKNALERLKIKIDESKLHDALYDAICTAEVFKRVNNTRIIKNYIVRDIMNMPSIAIRDFTDFNLDKNMTTLKCPKCNEEVELEYPLKLFSWKFWGLGFCGNCSSKILQESIVKVTLKGDNIYSNISKLLDDVEYADYTYKYKNTSNI